MKIEYIILGHDQRYPEDAILFGGNIAGGPHHFRKGWMEILADDYFSLHSGWEDTWPLIFAIYVDGVIHSNWKVECESAPQFTAKEVGS